MAAIAVFGVGTSFADSVATTDPATSVTKTSATLHGTIAAGPNGEEWTFQYGRSLPSVQNTGVLSAGPGVTVVSATLTGLSPGTTYQFRLVAVDPGYGSQGPTFHPGAGLSFRTKSDTTSGGGGGQNSGSGSGKTGKFGKAKLVHRRLKVKGGVVSIPLQCVGAKGLRCTGKVSLSATRKVGKTRRTLNCGSGRFSASGGHAKTIYLKLPSQCAALLNASHQRSISATLRATFTTHQGALKQRVTLFA